jgi:hypothetical protein
MSFANLVETFAATSKLQEARAMVEANRIGALAILELNLK